MPPGDRPRPKRKRAPPCFQRTCRWDVNTSALNYSPGGCAFEDGSRICIHNDIQGYYTDDFVVEGVAVSGCTSTDNLKAVLLQNGAEVSGYSSLSCFNQEYDIIAAFECRQCDVGMVLDPTEPSGCAFPASPPPSSANGTDDDDGSGDDEDLGAGGSAAIAMGCGIGVLVGVVTHQQRKLNKMLRGGAAPPGGAPPPSATSSTAELRSAPVEEAKIRVDEV